MAVRTTRRAFRRKLLTFGLATFMCVALSATGFAAWMLSNDARADVNGGLQVGAVSEAGIEIDPPVIDGSANFLFEPQASDTTGRVRYDGANSENLDVVVSWSLSNYQSLKETVLEFKVPETVQDLVTEGYVSLPGWLLNQKTEDIKGTDGVERKYFVYTMTIARDAINTDSTTTSGTYQNVLAYEFEKTGDSVTMNFTLTIAFAWGETRFGGQNPGVYFDLPDHSDASKTTFITYETIRDTLNELKAASHGLDRATLLAQFTAQEQESLGIDSSWSAGKLLSHLSKDKQDALFAANAIPNYYLVINAIA